MGTNWPMLAALYVCLGSLQFPPIGEAVIASLHGQDRVRELREKPHRDVSSLNLAAFCEYYEGEHWHPLSNRLHSVGACLLFFCCLSALLPSALFRTLPFSSRLEAVLLGIGLYYSFNWCGHFVLQGDIPAVVSYSTSFRNFAFGEWCQYRAVVLGRFW
eukprot:TRINITY_DN1361_c0_g1_i1.p1 TRINITY_DN1361_c0_g1~~TRINITY_DN1361_c0_g1_i1.p1  ORF type:complete len:183 (+),score=38.26 TRINITY_DN1361_c0_g1_i1:75-551(+)